jgi:signal transduction histidine kinase
MPQGGTLFIGASRHQVHEDQPSPFSDTVPPGNYVRLVVSDTGEGMDKGTLRRAFEPFLTTKEVGKGSGLGLASVYGIVHQHQGWIQLSSARGQGTQFTVYLPEVEAEA